MIGARNASLLVAAALVLLLSSARWAGAFDLKLWPLFDLEARSGESRLSLLGPLVEWRRDAGGDTSFDFRPLFHRERDGERSAGTLLYPLASWERTPDATSVSMLGLVSYARSTAGKGRSSRRFRLFPLIFFESSPERGARLSVLPLYADLEGLFGYRRVRAILLPLFLELEEPLAVRRWLVFPFFSWVGGSSGEGVRLWPIHGHTAIGGESDTTYWLWPFYVRRTLHPGSASEERSLVVWPLFSTIEGPELESRSYSFLPLFLVPLYTHTIDRRAGTETWGFPWPVWLESTDLASGERRSLRLTPFYQDRHGDSLHSTFVLWPFYRRRSGVGDDAGYERRDVLFFLYRDELVESEHRHLRVLWPLWIERSERGASRAQSLTLLEGILPGNRKLEDSYAPLVRLYGRCGDGDEQRHDVLWKMWEWGGAGGLRPPWYLSVH